MKIFITGPTGSGKTTLARAFEAYGFAYISASEWVRKLEPEGEKLIGHERASFYSIRSIKHLSMNPAAAVEHMLSMPEMEGPCVIDGVRNPYDFIRLFDPRTDIDIYLDSESKSDFERWGLETINVYVNFLIDSGIGSGKQFFEFDELSEREQNETIVSRVLTDVRLTSDGVVHMPVPTPIRCALRQEFLFDMDPTKVGWVRCEIVGICSYTGHAPTFDVRLEDGSLFSYIPPHALSTRQLEPSFPLETLAYHNCPSERVGTCVMPELKGRKLRCFLRREGAWVGGDYVMTLDWHTGNDLLHLVILENGQPAFLPHHKIKIHTESFKPYKKMRSEWIVRSDDAVE